MLRVTRSGVLRELNTSLAHDRCLQGYGYSICLLLQGACELILANVEVLFRSWSNIYMCDITACTSTTYMFDSSPFASHPQCHFVNTQDSCNKLQGGCKTFRFLGKRQVIHRIQIVWKASELHGMDLLVSSGS